jgi:nucleotide-binding universal stress UspA family protein
MNIVVGYIPTPEGLAAVEYATVTAEREQAKVYVVNAGVRGNDTDPSFAAAEDLDAIAARLAGRGIDVEIRQPAQAELPAEVILETAEQVGADMIVIGLRRRSLVGKLFLGSTSQHVIIEADCPVVSVKGSR